MTLVFLATPFLFVSLMFRSFLYYPTSLSAAEVAALAENLGFEEVRLGVASETRLVGLVRTPADPQQPWALFFGGNAMDLASSLDVLRMIDGGSGFGLAVFAYRGYDGSDGRPTEEALLHDAEAAVRWLENERDVSPADLVLVGQSLGSGIAAHVAAMLDREGRAPRGLALLSPYTSIARVFDEHVPILPVGRVVADRYDTMALIGDLTGPIVIVHGSHDEIIGIHHSEELAGKLGARARLIVLEGCSHNDLWLHSRTTDEVRRLLMQ